MSLMECRGATSRGCFGRHGYEKGNGSALIILGGIRTGADVNALALGAGAVSIGQGVLIALGCNGDGWVNESSVHIAAEEDYLALDTALGYCNHCHAGNTRLESLPRILFWNVTSYPK